MDKTRERLIELIECEENGITHGIAERTADYLLDNGVTINIKKERPPTDLRGKCGSCEYAKPGEWGKSKVYVCCTNKEHLACYSRNRITPLRPRTTRACKRYKAKGEE